MEYQYLTKPPDVSKLLESGYLCLDTETTSLSPLGGCLRLVQIRTTSKWCVVDILRTGSSWLEFLRDYKGILIGHNLKFDIKFLGHLGYWPRHARIFDTHRASRVLHNGETNPEGFHGLDKCLERYGLPYSAGDYQASDWSGELSKEQLDYAAEDVRELYQLFQALRRDVHKAGLSKALAIDCEAILPEAWVELSGFKLNKEKWLANAEKNRVQVAEVRQRLDRLLPHPKGQGFLPGIFPGINYNSPDQVLGAFRQLGINLESTDRRSLLLSGHTSNVAVATLLEYRKYEKASTSFGPDYLKHVDRDGRIRSNYWPHTGAGRYSSSDPNLQQLPRDKAFRECFEAEEGNKLVIADYGQIELRGGADISGDPELIRNFIEGIDPHARTGSILSSEPLESISKATRQKAKAVNFGLLFGMGAPKLKDYAKTDYNADMTLEEAEQYIAKFFSVFKVLRRWQFTTTRAGQSSGEARTASGRRRFLDKDCYSEYLNTPVQGTCADGTKRAMRKFFNDIYDFGLLSSVRLCNVVHDEMVVESPAKMSERVGPVLENAMISGMSEFIKKVPITADAGVCDNWSEK